MGQDFKLKGSFRFHWNFQRPFSKTGMPDNMLVHSFLCVFVCALVCSASRTSQQSTWRSTKPVWNRRRTTSSLNQLHLPSTSLLLSSSKAPSFFSPYRQSSSFCNQIYCTHCKTNILLVLLKRKRKRWCPGNSDKYPLRPFFHFPNLLVQRRSQPSGAGRWRGWGERLLC